MTYQYRTHSPKLSKNRRDKCFILTQGVYVNVTFHVNLGYFIKRFKHREIHLLMNACSPTESQALGLNYTALICWVFLVQLVVQHALGPVTNPQK